MIRSCTWSLRTALVCLALALPITAARAQEAPATTDAPKAFIDGTGEGWRPLTKDDFVNVNCHDDTWTWNDEGVHCTGSPTGVMRTTKKFTNFELVCEWNHRKNAGNSGIFVWTTPESIERLAEAGKPGLPQGIEVQVLDLGYAEQYEKSYNKPADWFTSHGDVFPVGVKMKPFPPVAPDGVRSFPSKELTKGVGEWNHYYVRAINGEVRLWVNGEEVSGGTSCEPSTGYLCLESEGSPIDFRNLRIRELP
ncbi:3-keto-disaccharide hydrolase [Aeoliella mucimassa]|uniref:3-keto-alpha-glucoside-1,2-lyase/3-keto-2-hydroxy-glucal hydratase domain-containing protein n=1 Tax=Aeoliella mucimassa TaxID=2527972 RepID=A0A518AGX3_9BACT|nr:DUF1080 domain-containing protein [Aeoliella mucimassa]QDU53952.1 hypothetical protein Pan181_01310 [Aeoliella mucimassa]